MVVVTEVMLMPVVVLFDEGVSASFPGLAEMVSGSFEGFPDGEFAQLVAQE